MRSAASEPQARHRWPQHGRARTPPPEGVSGAESTAGVSGAGSASAGQSSGPSSTKECWVGSSRDASKACSVSSGSSGVGSPYTVKPASNGSVCGRPCRVGLTHCTLRPGLAVVVGLGLLVGFGLEARLDVGVDRRGELLAGVVGHVTPSSPGPSWPSSSPRSSSQRSSEQPQPGSSPPVPSWPPSSSQQSS